MKSSWWAEQCCEARLSSGPENDHQRFGAVSRAGEGIHLIPTHPFTSDAREEELKVVCLEKCARKLYHLTLMPAMLEDSIRAWTIKSTARSAQQIVVARIGEG